MQTVSESFDPESVKAGLEALKSGIASAAAMEKALMKEKAEKHSALRKEAQRHAEVEERNLDARIKTLADEYKVDLEDALIWKEKRLARIQTAYHSSKSSLARRTQEAKDRRIGKVQGAIMRNRQMRQQDLEAETARHTSFQKQILDDRGVRRELRRRVLSAMRTYRPWIDRWFDGAKKDFPEVELPATAEKSRAELVRTLDEANLSAEAAERLTVTKFFRFIPLWAVTLVVVGSHLWLGMRAGGGGVPKLMPSLLITLGVLGGLWLLGLVLALPVIRRAAETLAKARTLEVSAERQSAALVAALNAEIKEEQNEEKRNLSETFRTSDEEWRARVAEGQKQLDQRHARVPGKLENLYQKKLAALKQAHEEELNRVRNEFDGRARVFEQNQNGEKEVIDGRIREAMEKVAAAWSQNVLPHDASLRAMDRNSISLFPAWTSAVCDAWQAPDDAPDAVRLGHLVVDEAKLSGGLPSDDLLALPDGPDLTVPFSLGFPHQGSLLIESDGSDDGASARVLNAAVLRILASHPPGRASFVFIDPVGLGKDFAGLMHLADYEETLINHRIWTQNTQIEERLAELNEHIEKVIQMYLRNEYADINAYNQQAGTIAEKYRFVVIAGFPAGFSDTAAKRLMAIASSGARCGVHLLIQRDLRLPAPDPALEDELRRVCRRVVLKNGVYHLTGLPPGADVVEFDPAPAAHDAIQLVHKIGKASIDSNRVQVPFSQIAPPSGEEWSLDTSEELRVPIGRTGAKKLQMLAIGKGTRQHMLVAGKTGSGKSTLFHVIITNLARWASPEQVEFYLVDFKKGVEFKCYAAKHLPHARVVAIESDREFALSVLQRVDAELKRRGELFRKAGAQDVAGYKKTPVAGPMPRTLLLIDEFQEFFTEDDAVAQEASLLMDRIVRQGRAFGIHVILGSQTLGGAYTLARATLGQMVIRVALQCNEADAQLIMDDDNPAPRLLTRPGEGIYNDQAGALAANSPFQIVWLPEDERDTVLDEVNARARASSSEVQVPIVFEGNAPAEIRDNAELAALIRHRPSAKPKKSRAWLGAPNSIKGPTEAVFQRQSGSHLLAVGQSTERTMSQLAVSLASLALQYPPGQAEFVVLDPHASEGDADGVFHRLAAVLPNNVRIGGPAEVSELMNSLSEELAKRLPTSGREAPELFLIVHDLQRFKALRPEDEFKFSMDDEPAAASPSKVFADLLGEGGPCGMHVLVSTDTWNNVSRWIPRKLMAEFEMRVLFQMSANDSANLIDSPAATTLGLHRALFYNEHLGTLETFRPYALPDSAWIEDLAGQAEPSV